MAQHRKPAVAYLRTSSAANVGEDKDSHKRQLAAINVYAERAGLRVIETFYDAAVSGADPIDRRPDFARLLAFLDERGGGVVLVETANRFSRDLITAETGHAMLKARNIDLVAVDSPESFLSDSPTAVMVRQMLAVVAQFEKSMVVAKLRGARDRKRAEAGKCEGRKSHAETRPHVVALARGLHRRSHKTGKRPSLRSVAAGLAAAGHVNSNGRPFSPSSVKSMLEGAR